ncbi:hypothetical protein [Sulfuricurvum sp.]|nr:hypothetical protein [Sulfuricurvum sp.]MDD2781166.1 hypothetical protein [Sulfuricurvum sp.]
MSKESISKIYLEYIEEIIREAGSITRALEDAVTKRPHYRGIIQ